MPLVKLRQLWETLRSSLWFIPGVSVLLAVALAVALVELDGHLEPDVFARWPRLFGSGAAGARGLLESVASSMITIAGVVFSITVVALSLTSTQYTSRVLRNFMRDRVNQSVLGVFVGVFAYCLVVLRTIRGDEEHAFVPSLALLVGLGLAFVGIGVFILFIHHISTSIQAAQILATVTEETIERVDHLFPEGVGDDDATSHLAPLDHDEAWHAVTADKTGYLISLDAESLVKIAADQKSVVRMERAIGHFVIEDTRLVSIAGPGAPDEQLCGRLRSCFAIGRQRTLEQDAAFGIRQIVDIALKALSPGVNDTTTAVMSVHYLTAILARLSHRRIVSRFRTEDGELRLVTRGPTYDSLVGEALDQIRQSAAGNVEILAGLLAALELLASLPHTAQRRRVLLDHAHAVIELAHASIAATRDRDRFDVQALRLADLLAYDSGATKGDLVLGSTGSA